MRHSICSYIFPWRSTLQQLKLSSFACVLDSQDARGSLSFLSELAALRSLTLTHVSPWLRPGDLAGCTSLEKLCLQGPLTYKSTADSKRLDLSTCTSLLEVECAAYALEQLNVSGCTKLQQLDCSNQPISALDVSTCTQLRVLNCSETSISFLNLTSQRSLKELRCKYASLVSLDLAACAALEILVCDGNYDLAFLALPDSSNLKSLCCRRIAAAELDLSHQSKLQRLRCGGQNMLRLDVASCTSLQVLECYGLRLNTLDLRGVPSLRACHLAGNSHVEMLNLAGLSELQQLTGSYASLGKLDVSGCAVLQWYQEYVKGTVAILDLADCKAMAEPHMCSGKKWDGLLVISCKHCTFDFEKYDVEDIFEDMLLSLGFAVEE